MGLEIHLGLATWKEQALVTVIASDLGRAGPSFLFQFLVLFYYGLGKMVIRVLKFTVLLMVKVTAPRGRFILKIFLVGTGTGAQQ